MKGNQVVLVVAFLLSIGLFSLAGALFWFGLRQSSPTPIPVVSSETPTESLTIPQSLDGVELKSDRNVNYTQLREYLRAKDFKSADRETYLRMLDAAGATAQANGMIPKSEMNTLSCDDLRTIDRLWSTATNGQQGFTIQMTILKAVGSDYRKLYDTVGWQKLPPSNAWAFEWKYNTQERRMEFVAGKLPNYTNPPPGHLPTVEIGYNLDVAFSGALRRCAF